MCKLDNKCYIGIEILKCMNIVLNCVKKNLIDNFEYYVKDIED